MEKSNILWGNYGVVKPKFKISIVVVGTGWCLSSDNQQGSKLGNFAWFGPIWVVLPSKLTALGFLHGLFSFIVQASWWFRHQKFDYCKCGTFALITSKDYVSSIWRNVWKVNDDNKFDYYFFGIWSEVNELLPHLYYN